ncbi:hypothetical protein D3C76_1712950 [compost metagenome]
MGAPQVNVTIEGSTYNNTVNGDATPETLDKLKSVLKADQDSQLAAFKMEVPALTGQAIRDALGAARSQQAELQ